jgi:AraC family transcriptional regulator
MAKVYRKPMSLTHHPLHQGTLLHIGCACCRPQDKACGELEQAAGDTLAFPLRGVFVKHHEGGPEVVASAGQALFFNAGEAYRVSHPAGGSDDCLTLQLAPGTLRELLRNFDAVAADREHRPFGATHAALPNAATLQRQLLWQGLRDGSADLLEIETRALELAGSALGCARPFAPRDSDRRPQARRRRREQARSTAVTLAAQPDAGWSLEQLSQRVHASPFHLARSFREELGEPIHQYLLRARLVRALAAVLDSDQDFTAIALALGFSTPSHFTAAFRKAYGCSPSELRRRGRPGQVRELRKISTALSAAAH